MSEPHDTSGRAVTPGNYDGVHAGHRALLQAAKKTGLPVTALFFWPHPAAVLGRKNAPMPLTTKERRRELLLAFGADEVAVVNFTRELSQCSPAEFLEDVLVKEHRAAAVVVGSDFRFGRNAEGNVAFLKAKAKTLGFEVKVVEQVHRLADERASSTSVRELIGDGHVDQAAEVLMRYHDTTGTVVLGHQRGRTIGVPTANLEGIETLLPKDGVYAVWAKTESHGVHAGVANLGVRPTVNAGRSVEVHLLDFAEDLYTQSLRVGFVKRLRDEMKFDGLEALKAQIDQDIGAGRSVLSDSNQEWKQWL